MKTSFMGKIAKLGIIILFAFPFSLWSDTIPLLTIEQIQRIGIDPDYPLDGNYILMQDIDAFQTRYWNNGKGFRPIGLKEFTGITGWVRSKYDSKYQPFEGVFDGNGHKIVNLYMDNLIGKEIRPSTKREFKSLISKLYPLGLFYEISQRGCVKNLVLENVYIHGCFCDICVITRFNFGKIENVHVSGELDGSGNFQNTCGLAVINFGEIRNCSVSCEKFYAYNLGGLVHSNKGLIEHSFFSGRIFGTYGGGYVEGTGGLVSVNNNKGIIKDCFSEVQIRGGSVLGGLVGKNLGTISRSYSIVNAWGEQSVGGLIGINIGEVKECFATGEVRGTTKIGGLAGENIKGVFVNENKNQVESYGILEDCFFTGDVKGNDVIGGLVGVNDTSICNCYSIGVLTKRESIRILNGELVGNNKGNVENCVWELSSSGSILPSTGIGKSPLEMKGKNTYISLGWDFEKIWKIEEGNTYPYFTWLENYPDFIYIP